MKAKDLFKDLEVLNKYCKDKYFITIADTRNDITLNCFKNETTYKCDSYKDFTKSIKEFFIDTIAYQIIENDLIMIDNFEYQLHTELAFEKDEKIRYSTYTICLNKSYR